MPQRIMLTLSDDAVELLRKFKEISPGAGDAEIVEDALVALKERNDARSKADEDLRFGREAG